MPKTTTNHAEPDVIGTFAANLRAQRTARGLTLAELARRVRYSERYLELIERGDLDPTINTLAGTGFGAGPQADPAAGSSPCHADLKPVPGETPGLAPGHYSAP